MSALDRLTFRQVAAVSGNFIATERVETQLVQLIDYTLTEGQGNQSGVSAKMAYFGHLFGRLVFSKDIIFNILSEHNDVRGGPLLTVNFNQDGSLNIRTSRVSTPSNERYDLDDLGCDVVISDIQAEIGKIASDFFDESYAWFDELSSTQPAIVYS